MDEVIKLAMIQCAAVHLDVEAMISKCEEMVIEASENGAHVVLFPECASSGYANLPRDVEAQRDFWEGMKKCAQPIDGPFVRHFARLAARLKTYLVVTLHEKDGARYYNTAVLVSDEGTIVGKYSKVHTCCFNQWGESFCTDGDNFHVYPVEIHGRPINIGMMICYDREFPESARILMIRGADLILVPNACGIEEMRKIQLRTRAFENVVYIAMTNYASPTNNGHSMVIGPDGQTVAEADEMEQILYGEMCLQKLLETRQGSGWGMAHRRPHKYGLLCQPRNRIGRPEE